MKTLKSELSNLIARFGVDCSIEERSNGGYKVRFYHLIPSTSLTYLISFSQLYNYAYYVTGIGDSILEFNVYR